MVIATTAAAFTMTTAQADTTTLAGAQPQLCEVDDGRPDVTVTSFPYVMVLEESQEYPSGVRSCNYSGERPIVYMCDGDTSALPPVLNVISNVDRGRRSLHRTVCDGNRHSIAPADAYRDNDDEFSGPYHLHWHLSDASGWDSAYLEVR